MRTTLVLTVGAILAKGWCLDQKPEGGQPETRSYQSVQRKR